MASFIRSLFSKKEEEETETPPPQESTALISNGDHKGHDHSHSHSHSHDNQEPKITQEPKGSHDNHNHNHGHGISPTKDNFVLKRLKMATALCLTFMLVEVIGGYLAGSLAVLSDAAHLMADLASFAVAIAAAYLAARPSTPQHTYGLKRTESLAALFSMVTLAMLSVVLALAAIRRIYAMTIGVGDTTPVDGKLMSGIATIGVLVNLALAAVLGENHTHLPGHDHDHSHDHDHDSSRSIPIHNDEVLPEPPKRNVNLHAAYLHVMADLAQSVAVLIAGLLIWWKPDWKIVDPIATILFCCLVFWSTLGVIRSAVCVLLEEVPPHISWQTISTQMEQLKGIANVHDLHVWSISHGINALSVHVVLAEEVAVNAVLSQLAGIARRHGISHSTIQVQTSGVEGCITCAMADESQSCMA